jgi:hypothetical protein
MNFNLILKKMKGTSENANGRKTGADLSHFANANF